MPKSKSEWKEEAEYLGVMSDAQELNIRGGNKMTNVPEDSVFDAPEMSDSRDEQA